MNPSINFLHARTGDLSIDRFSVRQEEAWCIFGSIRSGIHEFFRLITGDMPGILADSLDLPENPGIVSFSRQQALPVSSLKPPRHLILMGLMKPALSSSAGDHPACYQNDLAIFGIQRGIGMKGKAQSPFRDLSFADQRVILIARALIKLPRLLILDEPTQGLDELNRKAVLDFIEDVAKEKICTILYVSHREDEFRDFFIQHIRMG